MRNVFFRITLRSVFDLKTILGAANATHRAVRCSAHRRVKPEMDNRRTGVSNRCELAVEVKSSAWGSVSGALF